ncbi:MAG TPA: GNAT family N-acetyltransferase [Acidimicrobiia bacterium]|nr:GNAT family N-acetyltransferase [Acidimicrobiia bacterium]
MSWRYVAETTTGPMECLALTPDRLGDMATVFGERGVARQCFCMHWRRPDGGYPDRRDNKERFAELTNAGPPPGLLGYVDGHPKGWVQVGPRSDFPTIGRSRLLKSPDDVDAWSINCFVVKAGERRQGIGRGLLAAAIGYATDQGAKVIEAYPVDGARQSVVDYFTGTLKMFSDHGFVEIIRRNDTRPIVRLTV